MEFTISELFLLQSLIGDGIKTLENVRAENLRASAQSVYSHQFVLNNTLIKAIEHRLAELKSVLEKIHMETSNSEEADASLEAIDDEKEATPVA